MSNLIEFYFDGLFTSEVHAPNEEVLNKVRVRVTREINQSLCRHFTKKEVKKALFKFSI
jgi:hypothetical protein